MSPHEDLTPSVIRGLGWLYLVMFFMNIGWTVRSYKRDGYFESLMGFQHLPKAMLWALYSAFLFLFSATHLTTQSPQAAEDFPFRMPVFIKTAVDGIIANPINYFAMSIILFVLIILLRNWLVRPTIGWLILNFALLFLGLSMTDYDFRQIVGKPDNVPIVGMLFLVGYFTWLYFQKAVENDRRIAGGLPKLE